MDMLNGLSDFGMQVTVGEGLQTRPYSRIRTVKCRKAFPKALKTGT